MFTNSFLLQSRQIKPAEQTAGVLLNDVTSCSSRVPQRAGALLPTADAVGWGLPKHLRKSSAARILARKPRNRCQSLTALGLFEPQAAGDSLFGLKSVFQATVFAAYAVGILKSLSSTAAKGSLATPRDEEDQESIGVQWGTMSVISFLPLFNWLVQSFTVAWTSMCLLRPLYHRL